MNADSENADESERRDARWVFWAVGRCVWCCVRCLSACYIMSQVRLIEIAIALPAPTDWHGGLAEMLADKTT